MSVFPGREGKLRSSVSSPALHSFAEEVNTKSCAARISSAGQWLHDDAAGANCQSAFGRLDAERKSLSEDIFTECLSECRRNLKFSGSFSEAPQTRPASGIC
jgi:hypothetical protein